MKDKKKKKDITDELEVGIIEDALGYYKLYYNNEWIGLKHKDRGYYVLTGDNIPYIFEQKTVKGETRVLMEEKNESRE